MKNTIIKGISMSKMIVSGGRRLQCKTDFKFLKWQVLFKVPENRAAKS